MHGGHCDDACIAGFDSCSHLSEETKGANSAAPLAVVWSIAASAVLGYALLVGMLFCVQVDPWFHACGASSAGAVTSKHVQTDITLIEEVVDNGHPSLFSLSTTQQAVNQHASAAGLTFVCHRAQGLRLRHAEQDPGKLFSPSAAGEGYAAGQLVWDIFNARFGTGKGSICVLLIFYLAGSMCAGLALESAFEIC